MVDIVMATYNGSQYIGEQLDSILNQTYKDIRILIRDDGSKDNTCEIIRAYEKRYPNKVIMITDAIKCGSAKSNFMQAVKYSTSDYVMFSDQDDYWLPEKIQHTLDRMIAIEKNTGKNKPVLVFGSYIPVDENLNEIFMNKNNRQEAAYKLSFNNLLVQNYVNGCLMMVNRKLVKLMGECNDDILMHDWWAALIASGCGAIEHIDEIMMLYRQHKNNVVGSIDVKSPSYIKRKIKDRNTQNACKQYLRQAKLLETRCGTYLYPEEKKELEKFIELYNYNKFMKVYWLIKGRYLKSDIVRILGQLWYI